MQKFELIIFDCDGVLVDSEPITNRVFGEMLRDLGMEVTLDDMFELFVGYSMTQCLTVISERLGKMPPPDFVQNYYARARVALEAELTAVPGVVEALDQIRLPYCVASSGAQEKMRMTLGITGLLPRFEGRMFSATEVARGKPAPDIFLHTASKFGVRPAACLVVEDTPPGVAAGVAAGMTVYGYSAQTPAARLLAAGAHRVFDDMTQLPLLLGKVS
jgi:HAD superfamily hydrolase (TIGR01509 family)